ncbi:MAG: ABC transporter ATP-binding protein [Lachnospiraceae bacterium]|nr:ABC transporter ATP-binding protein [Lachnospiraceae bacterium]MBP3595711.1 ABC transporter ATP-binding protein [Lachnospiraceae bacterium]
MGFLDISQLNYSYHTKAGETKALSGINLAVREGEFLAIVGPSGCGKSTLLNLIAGLLKTQEGNITIEGAPVAESRDKIGYMLQKDHLMEWRSTEDNIRLGLEINKMETKEKEALMEQMLKQYGLYEFRKVKPKELSGGMRQRAALIRTLVMEPELLLLDEPFSALDYQTRLSVADDIYAILKAEGKTAVMITHDIAEAISMSERVIVLTSRPGRIRKEIQVHLTMEDGKPPVKPSQARSAREFAVYYQQIWKELMGDDDER